MGLLEDGDVDGKASNQFPFDAVAEHEGVASRVRRRYERIQQLFDDVRNVTILRHVLDVGGYVGGDDLVGAHHLRCISSRLGQIEQVK